MSIIAFQYFTAETSEETSQIIKQAVTGIHEEGDEIRFEKRTCIWDMMA